MAFKCPFIEIFPDPPREYQVNGARTLKKIQRKEYHDCLSISSVNTDKRDLLN